MRPFFKQHRFGRSAIASIAIALCACTVANPQSTPPTSLAPTRIPATIAAPQPLFPTPTADLRANNISSPQWLREAVIYEVFPRSFYDSDGDGIGDLPGIQSKLAYIQSLGANTLWLTPFYSSTTYHGYDVADYTSVNPQFGRLQDFTALTAAAHQRGMKIMVDYVANHSSSAHPFFKDAYKNPGSRYSTWYHFTDANNTQYQSFAGVQELPEWNHDNPAVEAYLLDAAEFWLNAGADGLRCDYALGVQKSFWKELRTKVKSKHPAAVLLGEVFDGSPVKLRTYFSYGFDALFDFPWFFALSNSPDTVGQGVLNGASPAKELIGAYKLIQALYPPGAQVVRFANNHDTNRLASSVDNDAAKLRLAAALNMLGPGTPMLYYGEEIGMRGIKGPGPIFDEYRREPMDWFAAESGPGMPRWFRPADRNNKPNDGVSVEEQDQRPDSLLQYYRQLGRLRKEHSALRSVAFQTIDAVEGCANCVAFWRWSTNEIALLIFNLSDSAKAVHIDWTSAPANLPGSFQTLLGKDNTFENIQLEAWGTAALVWPAAP